ncbi:MAG: glycosyltransferase family 39 protein [Fuerstiella sp.]|nr:glycosyltransferase family 39 protein [Fuerstiella sp.]
MNRHSADSRPHLSWLTALVLGLAAFLVSSSRINHGLVNSWLPNGPGLTTDESINVRQGLYLWNAFAQHGPLMMLPGKAEQVYGNSNYLADYVPLGRFLLGATHELTSWAISGAELSVINVPAARLTSSGALALTVFLTVLWTSRRYGITTAVIAGVLLMTMPRVVGHSRIASLETLTTLAWFAALMPLLSWWTRARPPTALQASTSGFLWGVLMLVKIQAVFLPPTLVVFAIWRYRLKALIPLMIVAVTGLVVFFCGWPWLWLDPLQNTLSYLRSTAVRSPVNNWYLGHRFVDKMTPFHYPFVIAAVTIPLHTTACMLIRLFQRRLHAEEGLLLLSVVLPLSIFAIPGIPVYDGTRLFLFIMPAVAILAARGLCLMFDAAWNSKSDSTSPPPPPRKQNGLPKILMGVLSVLLVADAAVTATQLGPFAGDAYNVIGRAFDPRGEMFECSYWGDALNTQFWEQVPEGSSLAVAPVLHPPLLQHMMAMIPLIRQRQIELEPFFYDPNEQRGLVLLIHRLADLPPELRHPPADNQPVVEIQLNDRVLARLIDTRQTTWSRKPEW